MNFSPAVWLEQSRIAVQSAWFGVFGAALWTAVWTFYRPRARHLPGLARGLWILAMAMIVGMWLGGAALEMAWRAMRVPGLQMTLALGAFSLLVAGVVSLARDWFGGRAAPLRAAKIGLSLLVWTLAGWWFGGLASQNPWWFLMAEQARPQPAPSQHTPDAWALLLGGATLLGASREVRSIDPALWRAANPRLATWWLAATVLLLSFPFGTGSSGAASILLLGGGVFACKIWRARHDCPRFLRAPRWARAVGIAWLCALPLLMGAPSRSVWGQKIGAAWHEPHQVAAWLMLLVAGAVLQLALRSPWRAAIRARLFDRALLHGTLAGFAWATLLLGPGGAAFWAFWPLCGLFFDLLATREPSRSSLAAELRAPRLAPVESAP